MLIYIVIFVSFKEDLKVYIAYASK